MKIKNKGKVHPSPSSSSAPSSSSSSSSSHSCNSYRDVQNVMKLLPAAILALASVLSLEDREVLAYMITRSMETPVDSSSKKRTTTPPSSRRTTANSGGRGSSHKPPPRFNCDCFDCYMSYWHRWDSSPNRELIHQVIEAFEEHLSNGELNKKNPRGKSKRRDKTGRAGVVSGHPEPETNSSGCPSGEAEDKRGSFLPENEVLMNTSCTPVTSPKKVGEIEETAAELSCELPSPAAVEDKEEEDVATSMALASDAPVAANVISHKGLARKVLPDVLGILNSRLWSLWSPNV